MNKIQHLTFLFWVTQHLTFFACSHLWIIQCKPLHTKLQRFINVVHSPGDYRIKTTIFLNYGSDFRTFQHYFIDFVLTYIQNFLKSNFATWVNLYCRLFADPNCLKRWYDVMWVISTCKHWHKEDLQKASTVNTGSAKIWTCWY